MNDLETIRAMLDRAGIAYAEQTREQWVAETNAKIASYGFTTTVEPSKAAEVAAVELRLLGDDASSSLEFDESGALLAWTAFE